MTHRAPRIKDPPGSTQRPCQPSISAQVRASSVGNLAGNGQVLWPTVPVTWAFREPVGWWGPWSAWCLEGLAGAGGSGAERCPRSDPRR